MIHVTDRYRISVDIIVIISAKLKNTRECQKGNSFVIKRSIVIPMNLGSIMTRVNGLSCMTTYIATNLTITLKQMAIARGSVAKSVLWKLLYG